MNMTVETLCIHCRFAVEVDDRTVTVPGGERTICITCWATITGNPPPRMLPGLLKTIRALVNGIE